MMSLKNLRLEISQTCKGYKTNMSHSNHSEYRGSIAEKRPTNSCPKYRKETGRQFSTHAIVHYHEVDM